MKILTKRIQILQFFRINVKRGTVYQIVPADALVIATTVKITNFS